jgi:hypothetical protein
MCYRKLTSFLSLLLMTTTGLFADVVVKYRVQADLVTPPFLRSGSHDCPVTVEEPRTGDIVVITWSTDTARLDRPGMSAVLRVGEERLDLLFHGARKYVSLKYPVPYEKYRLHFENEVGADLLRYRIESLTGPVQAKFLERNATRYSAIVSNGLRNQWRATFVLTTELPSEPGLALAIRAALHELRFGGNGWLGLLPIEGRLPLVWEEAERQPETEALYREEATEIVQQPLPADAYAVPKGYVQIDYDPLCMRTR